MFCCLSWLGGHGIGCGRRFRVVAVYSYLRHESPGVATHLLHAASEFLSTYKSPVKVRMVNPSPTATRLRPGLSPARGRVFRPRSPDVTGGVRGVSPRRPYSPAKPVPSKPTTVEPKPRGPTPVHPNQQPPEYAPRALNRGTPTPSDATSKLGGHAAGADARSSLGGYSPSTVEYPGARSASAIRGALTNESNLDGPRYRGTPVRATALRSSSAAAARPRASFPLSSSEHQTPNRIYAGRRTRYDARPPVTEGKLLEIGPCWLPDVAGQDVGRVSTRPTM